MSTCQNCAGTGRTRGGGLNAPRCGTCRGTGKVRTVDIRFTIPFRPASLKNDQVVGQKFARGGRKVANIQPGARTKRDRAEVLELLRDELGARTKSLLGDDDVGVQIVHDVKADCLHVHVYSCGPKPKGITGRKQDLHNMAELVLDCMQRSTNDAFGGVYDDDRQVVELVMRRQI